MAWTPIRFLNAFLVQRARVSLRALGWVAGVTVTAVVIAGCAVHWTDRATFHTAWDGVWWACTTVTTVGYGDVVPVSTPGRIVAVFLMFTGIGLVSILTAAIASALLAEDVAEEEHNLDDQLSHITQLLTRIEARMVALESRDREHEH